MRAARLLVVHRTGRATPSGCPTAPAGATHFTSGAHGSRAAHAQAGLDAEGATKFVTVRVAGGASEAECVQVAYTLAESPLVKTAVVAGDPNWGGFCKVIGRGPCQETVWTSDLSHEYIRINAEYRT